MAGNKPLRPDPLMSTPIVVSYRMTSEEFLRSQRHAMRQVRVMRWYPKFTFAVGIVIVISGISTYWRAANGLAGLIFTLAFASVFFAIPLLSKRASLKFYSRLPTKDKEITWEISPDSLVSKSELGSSQFIWSALTKVVYTSEGFLLYPNDYVCHWLPASAFRNHDDLTRFAELARDRVPRFLKSA